MNIQLILVKISKLQIINLTKNLNTLILSYKLKIKKHQYI